MNSLTVSILIPCYNAEKYVGEAIESALNQTHQNIEVVVVDDGSTDGSLEVIKSFGDRIRWEAGPNRGGCAARNRALELSRGNFIQYLDADDLLLPGKIEAQLPDLLEDRADLVFCAGCTLMKNGKIVQPGVYPSLMGHDPLIYVLSYTISTNGPLHRRSFLERVGGFRDGLPRAQEWDMHVRLAGAGARLTVGDRPYFLIRRHEQDRVSHYRPPPGYVPNLLFDNVEWMDERGWLDVPGRRESLAPIVHQHAKFAFRGGATDVAERGFALAGKIFRNYRPRERWWMRTAIRCLGPFKAEQVLHVVRKGRDGLRSFRGDLGSAVSASSAPKT